MGDGATIHQMPLMNTLAMTGTTPPMTISIQDCTKHMAEGGKNDASYIAGLFEEKVLEYDSLKICTNVFYSNVQKAGEVLMARFPHTFASMGENMLFCSSFHQLQKSFLYLCYFFLQSIDSRFFLFVQVLILKTCRLYNVFRSGGNHTIDAQFMAQSSLANRGHTVGLLHGAGTKMALWLYAMMRLLHLKKARGNDPSTKIC